MEQASRPVRPTAERKRRTFELPPLLLRDLVLAAAATNRSQVEILELALESWLSTNTDWKRRALERVSDSLPRGKNEPFEAQETDGDEE